MSHFAEKETESQRAAILPKAQDCEHLVHLAAGIYPMMPPTKVILSVHISIALLPLGHFWPVSLLILISVPLTALTSLSGPPRYLPEQGILGKLPQRQEDLAFKGCSGSEVPRRARTHWDHCAGHGDMRGNGHSCHLPFPSLLPLGRPALACHEAPW